jgi:hypothetical protein
MRDAAKWFQRAMVNFNKGLATRLTGLAQRYDG